MDVTSASNLSERHLSILLQLFVNLRALPSSIQTKKWSDHRYLKFLHAHTHKPALKLWYKLLPQTRPNHSPPGLNHQHNHKGSQLTATGITSLFPKHVHHQSHYPSIKLANQNNLPKQSNLPFLFKRENIFLKWGSKARRSVQPRICPVQLCSRSPTAPQHHHIRHKFT